MCLGQLGTSNLHPPVLTRLLVGDFVDAVVVEVPDFVSPVTASGSSSVNSGNSYDNEPQK